MAELPDPMRELAQKLLALEELSGSGSSLEAKAPIRVIEKLRTILTRFSGADGFTALLRRASVLSRTDKSSADAYTVGKDGSISFEGQSNETILTLTAHLLSLMATFIGKSLTLTLLSEFWPLEN
jgi:hypothetical protein